MKRKFIDSLSLFLTAILSVCFFACQKKEFDVETATVTSATTATVTFTTAGETQTYEETEKVLVIDLTDAKVVDYKMLEVMQDLQTATKFTFTETNGMISSINGVENPADWSHCWMLYTSDEEISVADYGTVTYQGETYNQTAFGAKDLTVKAGEIYLWWYQKF